MGSYATSYIAPNLSQLFGPFGPNPELEAETNRTLEVGVEHQAKNGGRLSVLFFNRREKNRIIFETIDPVNFVSQYRNSGVETAFRGVELEGEFPLCSTVDFLANYTFVEQDGGLALRVPKHKFNAQLQWQIDQKSNASLDFRYTGARQDVDFGSFENVQLDAFSLLNAYYSYRFNTQIRGFIQLENIANTNYVELTDFTTRGRNLRLGVVWNILP
jgi:vitamin B12 transporter